MEWDEGEGRDWVWWIDPSGGQNVERVLLRKWRLIRKGVKVDLKRGKVSELLKDAMNWTNWLGAARISPRPGMLNVGRRRKWLNTMRMRSYPRVVWVDRVTSGRIKLHETCPFEGRPCCGSTGLGRRVWSYGKDLWERESADDRVEGVSFFSEDSDTRLGAEVRTGINHTVQLHGANRW